MAKKKTRRKRKSRMELYRARKTPAYHVVTFVQVRKVVNGGNPQGVGEWTLRAAHPSPIVMA